MFWGAGRGWGRSRYSWLAAGAAALLVLVTEVMLGVFGSTGGGSAASAAAAPAYVPQTRVYYLGADEVRWNYAPAGRDDIAGAPFDATAKVYVQRGPRRIGSTYIKSL